MSKFRDALVAERDKQETIAYEAFTDAVWQKIDTLTKPPLHIYEVPGLYTEWVDDNFQHLDAPSAQLFAIVYFCNDDDADNLDVEFRIQVSLLRDHDQFVAQRMTLHRRSASNPQGWMNVGEVKKLADIARLLELKREP